MIDVLFCGNRGIFDGILTAALSIVRRTRSEEPFRIHLFTMSLTEIRADYLPLDTDLAEFLQSALRRYNRENEVILHDVTALYREQLRGCPNETAYCSPYTLIRLLADLVLDPECEKLLYLDADVLFNRDVTLLWNTDLTGYEYAAAQDHYGKYLCGPGYINAGVILFNMKKARKTDLFGKARQKLWQKKWVFADQSALIRATTRRRLLPQKFNDQKFLHRHTVVRHFSRRLFWLPYPHIANIKQWQIEPMRKSFGYRCFDDILDEYAALRTAYPEFRKEDEA